MGQQAITAKPLSWGNQTRLLLVLAAIAGLAGGCASVTSVTATHYQSVSVQASEPGQGEIIGASCELSNKNGKWYVTTPGSVMIPRSLEALQVVCRKTEHEPGSASVISAIRMAMYGNALVGGLFGAAVDHVDGAAYEYPEIIPIVMGSSIVIEPGDKPIPQETAATSANAMQAQQKKILQGSYTLQPSGMVVADSPALVLKRPKPVSVTNIAAVANYKKKRGDVCDTYAAKGDYCWWSPPGNYSMCPLHLSLNVCKATYGGGCQLGHGKVVPSC